MRGPKPNGGTVGSPDIKNLNRALRGMHTKVIYDHLPRPRAETLAQTQIETCKPEPYLYAVQAEEIDLCGCGQRGTVKHVLLDSRLWQTESKEQRDELRDRNLCDSLPHLLAEWSGRKYPDGKYVLGTVATEAL